MNDITCALKWNLNKKAYNTFKTDFLKTTSYDLLVTIVKDIYDGNYNSSVFSKGDVKFLIQSIISELKNQSELETTLIGNLQSILENIDIILDPYKNTQIEDTRAELVPNQLSKLIPILSPKLNSLIGEQFQKELFKIIIYDGKTVKNPSDLADNFRVYKLELFNLLQDYIGNITHAALYDFEDSSYFDIMQYKDVLTKTWNLINLKVNQLGIDGIYDINDSEFLEIVKAFYILNNFDDFVSTFFGNTIQINQDLYNNAECSVDQYIFKKQSKAESNHREDYGTVDADKTFSKIFQLYWSLIEYAPGKYLSKYDFNNLSKIIQHLRNDLSISTWDFLSDNYNTEALAIKIIKALKTGDSIAKFMHPKYGLDMVNAIIKYLENFTKAFKDANNNFYGYSAEEIRDFDVTYNFIRAFKNEVLTHDNIQFLRHTEKGFDNVTPGLIKMSKKFITGALRNSIKLHLDDYNFADYAPEFLSNTESKYLFSQDFLDYINKLTGLNLTKIELNKLLLDESRLTDLARYLQSIIRVVNTYTIPAYRNIYKSTNIVSDLERILDNTINKIAIDSNYLDYSSRLIEDNDSTPIKIYDQSGNILPTSANPNTGLRVKDNYLNFVNQFKRINGEKEPSHFLFAKFKQLLSADEGYKGKVANGYFDHIGYRQDVKIIRDRGKDLIIDAAQMSPADMVDMSFNDEFFESILSNGIFWNQLACLSDKTRIMLGGINILKGCILSGQSEKSFLSFTHQELKKLWKEQRTEYYKTLEKQIVSDLSKIFDLGESETLDDCIKVLETYTFDAFLKKYTEYNKLNPNNQILPIEFVHYVPGKHLTFNPTLYANINDKFTDEYYKEGLEQLKDYLKEIIIPERFRSYMYLHSNIDILKSMFNTNKEEEIYTFFGLTYNKQSNTWNRGSEDVYWIQEGSSLSETILEKYFALSNLCTDADIFMTAKPEYAHKSKGTEMSLKELLSDTWYDKYKQDCSNKYVTSTKRNNSIVATMLPMRSGGQFQVARLMRVAIVDAYNLKLTNYNNQVHDQPTHDGAGWTLGIAARWEEASYPMNSYKGTKKVIGFHQSMGAMHQVKLADYVIDNFMLANCFEAEDSNMQINWLERFRKMVSPAIFTDSFYNAFANERHINLEPIYRDINGTIYSLTNIKYDQATDSLLFTWLDETIGTEQTKDFYIDQILNVKAKGFNAYDLWQAFGGYNSLERVDGEYKRSNGSMNNVADIISLYDPSLKTKIISKLLDKECVKSGIVSLNSLQLIDDPKENFLNTVLFDTDRWGIQLDYTHESDESHIPSLTQVMSAIAFNGKNTLLVEDMYNTVAQLIGIELEKLNILWTDPKEVYALHRKLAKELIRSLSSTQSISDAENIAYRVLRNEAPLMAYSQPEVFYKLSSNIISQLNSDAIRLKFAGIAIIQNPATELIGIYEDKFRLTYTKDDLVKLGKKFYRDYEVNLNPNERIISDREYIQQALEDSRFAAKETIDANDFELEDSYQAIRISDQFTEIKRIITPEDLFELELKIQSGKYRIFKVYGRMRNLKVPLIKYDIKILNEQGEVDHIETKNFWLSDAVKWRREADQSGSLQEQLKALKFYHQTLEALNNNKLLKRDGSEIEIQNVRYTSGELILPKVNKTAQSLGNQTLYEILNRGVESIISDLELKLLPKSDLAETPVDQGYRIILVLNESEIVYTNDPVTDLLEVPGRIILDNNEHWFIDKFGNKLFSVPSNLSKVYINPDKLFNNKTQYIVTDDLSDLNIDLRNSELNKVISLNENSLTVWDRNNIITDKTYNKFSKYLDTRRKNVKSQLEAIATKRFNSINLSNYTVTARIPSQSFQSFMANKTIAFNLKDINDGYINIWQVWFLGSK